MPAELKTISPMEKAFTQAKKQGYPKYIDGDLICNICGEPWDSWGVSHGDMEKREKRRFYSGKGCPCCPK